MPTDFRASQIQTNKIIASGSSTGTATNALLLIYPISKQSGSNQGFINTGSFGLTGIGTDVFMFVSGAIGSRGTGASYAATVFGGDVHVSGVLTFNSSALVVSTYWTSTTNNTIFTTGSIQITGSVILGTGSHAQGQYLTVKTVPVGTTMNSEYNTWLHIAAGSVIASGSGGKLILSGGFGGYTSGSEGASNGGNVEIYGGETGDSVGPGVLSLGSGGGITLQGAVGGSTPSNSSRDAGVGGSIYATAGSGGSSSMDPALGGNYAGAGGSLSFTAGDGGLATADDSWATGGDGGTVNFFGGIGGGVKKGLPGVGGNIEFTAGQGGSKTVGSGSSGGMGGSIVITAGTPGASGSLFHGAAGNVTIGGGLSRDDHFLLSGSSLQLGGGTFAGFSTNFRRIFFSAPIDQDATGFPGRDIYMYVSGPINMAGGGTGNNKVVFPDVIMSGNFWMKSSSQNPTPIIYNGNRDGGMLFSGSNTGFFHSKNSSNSAKVYFGPITTFPNIPAASDAIFFVSGTTNGAFGNAASAVAVMPDTYFSGTVLVAGNISGSLQKLSDGAAYLVGGPGITINTSSIGQVEVSGNNIITIVSKSANFTLAITDHFVHIITTSSHVTMSLPSSPGARQFMITKTTGSNYVVISGSSYTVNGASGDYIMPGSTTDPTAQIPQAWMLYSDGSNWFVR